MRLKPAIERLQELAIAFLVLALFLIGSTLGDADWIDSDRGLAPPR